MLIWAVLLLVYFIVTRMKSSDGTIGAGRHKIASTIFRWLLPSGWPWIHVLWWVFSKAMAPFPVLLPGKSHRRRSLVGCGPRGRWESYTTERLHFHFSLSCIGEGNGNPLQCSCLENPRDGGAWWAAVYGVAQSQTRLKWFSSMAFHITVCYVAHHGGNISRQKLQGQFGTRLRHCPSRWSYSKKVMVSSDSRWAKRFNFQLVKCLSHTARGQAQKGKGNCCRNHYR